MQLNLSQEWFDKAISENGHEECGVGAGMSHLEILKQTFDTIGVFYVIEEKENGYVNLYISSEEETKNSKLEKKTFSSRKFFEFEDGELVSY